MKINIKTGARAGAYSAALTAIVVAVVIVINLIVNSLPAKYIKLDTSRESMFTFDEKTEQFIASLDEDVTVYHIAQEGSEDPYLTEILERYSDMNGHITVKVIDPAKQPTFTEKYTEDAVSSNSLIIESKDRYKLVPSTDVYYIYCEDMGGKVDTATFEYYYQMYAQYGQTLEYTQIFAGENAVASGIDYVTMSDIPKIYLLSGHSEPSLNSTLTDWLKLQNYETASLTLTKENLGLEGGSAVTGKVPEDADMLVITGLSSDLTEAELTAITDYVRGGGDILVMSNYSMAGLENFTRLAATYGIDNTMSLVIEGDAQSYSGSAFNIKATTTDSALVSGITDIYMPYSQGMKLASTMPEGMKATALLTTSDKGFAKKVGFDTQDSNYAQKQDGDIDGPICLGAVVECEDAGSVVWLASNYYMIQEDRYGTGQGACMVFASAVSDVAGGAETISVHTIEIGNSYLNVTEGSAGMWGIVMIGIIPLGFIGIGLWVWMKRRSN